MDWNARLTLIAETLLATNPNRIVRRSFEPIDQISDSDLEKGVFSVIGRGIKGLYRPMGDVSDASRQRLLIVGQCRVPNGANGEGSGEDVEAFEFAMVNDIETMLNGALPEAISGMEWLDMAQSGQLIAPLGWIVAEIEIGP